MSILTIPKASNDALREVGARFSNAGLQRLIGFGHRGLTEVLGQLLSREHASHKKNLRDISGSLRPAAYLRGYVRRLK